MKRINKAQNNTFVEINGELDGKEYFNSIFCPKRQDVVKAVRKHLMDFFGDKEEEVGEDYLLDLSKNITQGGGAKLEVTKPNSNIKGIISVTFSGF